jgi:hypothetical protein
MEYTRRLANMTSEASLLRQAGRWSNKFPKTKNPSRHMEYTHRLTGINFKASLHSATSRLLCTPRHGQLPFFLGWRGLKISKKTKKLKK